MIEISIREISLTPLASDPPSSVTRFLRTVDTANISAVVYAIDAALAEPIAAPPAPPEAKATRKRRKDAGKPRVSEEKPLESGNQPALI